MSRRFSNDEVPAAFRGGNFKLPAGRIITLVIVAVVACLALLLGFSAIQRVDPGFTAIVVDYGAGTTSGQTRFTQAPTGSFFLINPLTQRVAKYPLAQQTLSMVRKSQEGKVIGDDSVECNDIVGVRINIDSSTLWRVKPEEAGQLYFLRPNTPLVGETGADVEDLVVRREVRSAVTVICGTMSYEAIYGADRLKFAENVKALLQKNLEEQHIAVDSFLAGEVYLQPELAKAIADKVNAQQQAQQAAFLKQKAENEALANVAAAEGQKKVRILQGEAEAQYIQLVNAQLAAAPQYVQYIFSNKWNGTLPTTLITDGKSTPLLQLPTQPITPTVGVEGGQ
jgi:regulator of protease activity HflC (stomatin/prohibitin superfamily)